MALQAATLNELSGGRLILGLGLQARGYVEGWHGQRYERPVRAMREYLTILRRMFTGEPVTFEGELFSVRNFQLTMQPPERPLRIYMAAIGPQMLRLAGELADGVLGYCWSLEYVRDVVLPNLHEGAERGGRSLDGFDVACGFPALVGELDQIRGQALMFATAGGSSPEYAKSFGAAGFGSEVEEIAAHFETGDVAGALAVVTDEMADAVTIAGSPEHVRDRLDAYRDAGLDTVGLNPAAPGVFFPLYEGHFPEGATFPTFSFPAYLGAIDDVLAVAAA
jgi:alkanesulfonate monooxygenase SsuD/methylene tetrahydromethanopterin reductase-like flavin-dependent oxidoreductase (luciferase family)